MIMQLNSRQSMPHNKSASHNPVPLLELTKLTSDPGPFYYNPVNKTQDIVECEDIIDENEEHPDYQDDSKANPRTVNPTAGQSNAFHSRTSSFNKTQTNADISPLIRGKMAAFKQVRHSTDGKMRRGKSSKKASAVPDFGLTKFKLNRSKSINYITNP
mmetsp:Transcript_31731/g.48640  ORF Transcript_31731/g.48640 Transcript_31731/m.48640 type:complete len:158 (+) Transcript_31731:291-764(+)